MKVFSLESLLLYHTKVYGLGIGPDQSGGKYACFAHLWLRVHSALKSTIDVLVRVECIFPDYIKGWFWHMSEQWQLFVGNTAGPCQVSPTAHSLVCSTFLWEQPHGVATCCVVLPLSPTHSQTTSRHYFSLLLLFLPSISSPSPPLVAFPPSLSQGDTGPPGPTGFPGDEGDEGGQGRPGVPVRRFLYLN